MNDPRVTAFFRDLGPAKPIPMPMPIQPVKPSTLAAKSPAPTARAQYLRDHRAKLRDAAARRSPEGRLRRYGISLTTVNEDPIEWAHKLGVPFRGVAS